MLFPAVMAHLGQCFGQVQIKFMGISVLAGIVTPPTIVTQIGQMRDVPITKSTRRCDCGKDGTIPFAIPTGIANFDLATGFLDWVIVHTLPLLFLPTDQRRFQSSFQILPSILDLGLILP